MAKLDKLLIVPDTHAPYHDERAWKLVMKVARKFQPDTIIHQGDLSDCYSLSSHSKNPERVHRWKDEREVCRHLRGDLDRLEPKRKIFTEGNHEHRLLRFLIDKAPALHGIVDMDEQLQMTENEWKYVPYRDDIKVGKVFFTHDAGGAGKYSTATALDTYHHSVSIGHHHAVQYFIKGNATGEKHVGAQFGWLGDPNTVEYMHKMKVRKLWSPGFGIGYHNRENGRVFLTPCPIVHYETVVEGRPYRV